MKYRLMALSGLAASLVLAPAAKADSYTYDFSSSDNSVMLTSLTFTTAGSCSGAGQVCDITGITGTLTDTNNLTSPESIVAFAPDGLGFPPPGPYVVTPVGYPFLYDNELNPDGTGTSLDGLGPFDGSVLDLAGVVFEVNGATPLEVSLSGGGDSTYFLYESPDGVTLNNNGVGVELQDVTPIVPEPSPLLLMGTGLVMLALASRKTAPRLKAVKVVA
jgi:hypothetical protein